MATRTLAFPRMFNYVSNKINTVSGEDSIEASLAILLESGLRELLGDPEYGSEFHEYIYRTSGSALETIIKSEIVYRIQMYEPRITVTSDDIQVIDDETTVNIFVSYTINSNGEYKTFNINLSREE